MEENIDMKYYKQLISMSNGNFEANQDGDDYNINCAFIPANNNLKSRLRFKFSYICCIFSHEASTSGYCSRNLNRNSKVVYS